MKKGTTDPAKEIQIFSRIGMFNENVIQFKNVDGSSYDYSIVTDFEIGIKVKDSDVNDFLTLTEVVGLTRFGGDKLLVELSEDQSSKFKERTYYLELRRTINSKKKVWITSDNIWHNGKFNGVSEESETLTVIDAGQTIQIIIGGDIPFTPDVDGGNASSIFNVVGVDGGSAVSNYQNDQVIDGGNA